jgi:hypothetical protein
MSKMLNAFFSKKVRIAFLLFFFFFISIIAFTYNGSKSLDKYSIKEDQSHNSNFPSKVTYKPSGVIKITPIPVNDDVMSSKEIN